MIRRWRSDCLKSFLLSPQLGFIYSIRHLLCGSGALLPCRESSKEFSKSLGIVFRRTCQSGKNKIGKYLTSMASFEQLEPHGCFFGLLSLTLSLNFSLCFKVFLKNIMDISVYFSITKQGKVWLLFSAISFSNQTWWKDCHIDKRKNKPFKNPL